MKLARFGFLAFLLAVSSAAASPVTVPFVGCEADGMGGHVRAPKGKPVAVSIDPQVAARLAYYQVRPDFGVLAPRGWYCIDIYGSNGATLFVAPHPLRTSEISPLYEHRFAGPVIQVDFVNGNFSSRFDVAHLAARYFPEQRALVQNAIAEEREDGYSSTPYVSGPYPADVLVTRRKGIVEYITPPHSEGLGTRCWLKPDGDPIHSAAILMPRDTTSPDATSVMVVAARLPKDLADLIPPILQQAERHYAGAK